MKDWIGLAAISLTSILLAAVIAVVTHPVFFSRAPEQSAVLNSRLTPEFITMQQAAQSFAETNRQIESFRDEAVAQAVMVKGYIVEQNMETIPTEEFKE